MKYVLVLVLLLPGTSRAQSKVAGLGTYLIGSTIGDIANRASFVEQESYVKGTLTLPCTHVRTFSSVAVETAGIRLTNVVLVFYDDTLFAVSCDYNDALKNAFIAQHGRGIPKPISHFQVCSKDKNKPLQMWGEVWPSSDILTLVVYRKGYTADCELVEGVRLLIASNEVLALSSECELKHTDPLIEEFNQGKN